MPYKDIEKQREFQRKFLANRKSFFMAMLGGRCNKCESINSLEFDHIDRKSKESHRIWSWSIKRICDELRKCQLLCIECHSEKTALENRKEIVHGTSSAYDSKGCRCLECKLAKSKRNKLRRR